MPFDGNPEKYEVSVSDPVLDALKGARKLVSAGWVKGKFKTIDGRYCIVGAIREVTHGNVVLRETVKYMGGEPWWWRIGLLRLMFFNDGVGHSLGDGGHKHLVLRLFDETIARREKAHAV